jgi:nucleoside-diphosphate-sugar epimerase
MSTSSTTEPKLVLITGASGFVGSAVASRFLDLGHTVRLPFRKQEQANALLAEYGKKYEGRIETVVLKTSIIEQGAFDEAIKGAEVVAHAASPGYITVVRPSPLLRLSALSQC